MRMRRLLVLMVLMVGPLSASRRVNIHGATVEMHATHDRLVRLQHFPGRTLHERFQKVQRKLVQMSANLRSGRRCAGQDRRIARLCGDPKHTRK